MNNNIKKIREEKGLTQVDLAEKAGISRPFLSRIEGGNVNPTMSVVFRLAEVLGETTEKLFGKDGG